MSKTPIKEPAKQVLPARNLSLNEFSSNTYRAIIPVGHTKEMLETPNYWCHVASKLKRHYEIKCVADDFSFYAVGLVTDANTATARVWIVSWAERVDGETETTDLTDEYKISQNASGFRLVQKATGKVVKENMGTRKEALLALADLSTK